MPRGATIVRMLLGGAILVLVWQHAHWSVALAITLIGIGLELLSVAVLELQGRK